MSFWNIELIPKERISFILFLGSNPLVYKPILKEKDFFNSKVIVANRLTDSLKDVEHKVYTPDLFGRDS